MLGQSTLRSVPISRNRTHSTFARRASGVRTSVLPSAVLLEQVIRCLSRADLERVAQSAIDRLDDMDNDLDLEPSGDEFDGTGAEDDFAYYVLGRSPAGPGCVFSDPDCG